MERNGEGQEKNGREDCKEKDLTSARLSKWNARRRHAIVFRGRDSGEDGCHANNECYLKQTARGKVCEWMKRSPQRYSDVLDFALCGPFDLNGEAVHPSVAATCRVAPFLSIEEQEATFNVLDGTGWAARTLRSLPRDMLEVRVESCCDDYVSIALDATRPWVVKEDLGEEWLVSFGLGDLGEALDYFASAEGKEHAMKTAEKAKLVLLP